MIGNRIDWRAILLVLLAMMAVLISSSMAYYCSTCMDPSITPQISRSMTLSAEEVAPQRSSSFEDVLAPVSRSSGYDVILDVSLDAPKFIQGAISIPYDQFTSEGSLKPVSEVAKILGDAGISETDSILLYGQCLPCGVNSAYVYWLLKYLGHDKVRILDGGIDDWIAAELPTDTVPKILPRIAYTPNVRSELLATYDYVKSGKAQVVDARSFEQYGMGNIPRSLNIPFDQVLSNGRIKEEAELKDRFSGLDSALPVVVYSDTGSQGASVWLALELMGYNVSLYSMKDWLEHQPHLDIELGEIRADPNPASRGSPVKITAIFAEAKNATSGSTAASNATKKDCATCGFSGEQKGSATMDKSSGLARLGSSVRPASNVNGFICTAIINNATGSNLAEVKMKRISGDMFSGIWNANVQPGNYSATIVASANGATKIFQDALEIEITGFAKVKGKQ